MGDGFKIFLVTSGEDPVRDATSSMKEAEKKLKENGFITKWLPESECEKVKQKEKDRTYLFDPFDTEAFNHVRSVGCRILGPQCILTSLQFQMDIPRRSIPIYNLAMKDLVVCCSNIDQKVREDIHQKVEYMGGSYKKDFTDIVTHLIVGEVGSKKYQVAGDLGKQIMLAPWVNAVLEASREKYIHGTDDVFQEYVCPVFKSLVVTVSGLDSEERNIVRKTVESNGGKYSGEMKVNECTHLIINKPKGTKYSFAKKWKIHIVRTDWLYDSVERGYCLDERKFSVDGDTGSDDKSSVKTSTPEKEYANRTRMSTIADISCITNMSTNQHSHINETTASNHGNHQNTSLSETMESDRRKSEAKNSEVKRSRSIMEEMEESIKDIDLTKTPDDMFLDGCKIYLSGFRGAALEKLRKVINAGGGIRLNQLSENVTHVVIGERVESDIETLKTATYRPHTVTALWLAECYKQGHTVDEENYLSPELPPPVTESPKLAGEKKKNTDVRTGERMSQVKPAHVTEDTKPSQNTDDEFSDIMSQYLLQADQGMAGSRETTVVNQNPPPEGSQDQDDDLTQDPSKAMETEDTPEGKIFWKKTFLLFGFIEESEKELVDFIVEKGGKVLPHTTRTVPDYGMVPMDGFPVDRTVGEIVTNAWLQMCGEHDELLPLDSNELFSPFDINVEAQPLKTCVISVSGYSGTERDCLIYIAELLGARYQEFFVRKANKSLEANTHLVVREADGSKYTAAKKWGIPALSKRWLFACAKSGKVEPEDSYHIDCMPETNDQSQSGKLDKQGADNSVTNDRRQSAKNSDELEQNMKNKRENNRSRSDVNDKITEWQQKIGNHDNNADGNQDNEMDVDPADNNQNVSENMHVEDQERERKSEQSDENEGSNVRDNAVKVQSPEVKDQTPTESAVQENGSRTSQKENIGFRDTPVAQNQRVKELQGSSKITPKNSRTKKDELETPSPTRFMDLTRPFRPKFDLTDLQKFLETPEPERKKREEERKNKRSSLSLEEVFAFHLDKAVKFTSQYKKKSVDMEGMEEEGEVFIPDQMKAGPLQGVIIAVAKKLSSEQSELNNIVDSLGGDYRWQYDSSCTHFIFQGRANDTTKEFRVARDQKKTIVSPHWLYMCKEQNTRVDESSFPHNYNPNLTLAGLSNKKTSSPGRSTRRSVRNTPASSLASESTPSTATRSKQGAVEQKQKSPMVSSKPERSPKPGPVKDNSMVDGPSGDADSADHSDGNEKGDVSVAMEVGGTLDMRVELNKQLEDLMAANKKKKSTSSRRNSKKYSASGMSGDASSEGTGSANSSRLRENVKGDEENNSRRGSRLGKDGDSNSMPEASQVVQIAWDDPTGRLEQERLADRLARAMSPTQDMNVDLGAEFSDVEEDEQALANMEDAQQLQGEDKKEETRVPTPEAPPIAFPVNKQSTHVEPPRPIVLDDDDDENVQQENRPPPVFMLSGLSQEERVDFGALIESLGGKMLDTQHYEAACTHLVIATPARNEKFLSCVAAGKWVLHKSYFEACRQEGTFVQEEFYEWGGEGTKGLVDRMTTSKKLALAAHNWRVKIQQDSQSSPMSRGAFSGWTVLICTDAKKEENFRRLLQAGGATVLSIKPPFSGSISASHAFVDLNRAALSEDCLRCLVENGVICVKPEFIAAHLTDQPAPSLEDYCPSEVQSIMNRYVLFYIICVKSEFIAAHLTDQPAPSLEDYCPSEVQSIVNRVTAPLTGKRKTQGSGSSTSGQSRSKRLRRTQLAFHDFFCLQIHLYGMAELLTVYRNSDGVHVTRFTLSNWFELVRGKIKLYGVQVQFVGKALTLAEYKLIDPNADSYAYANHIGSKDEFLDTTIQLLEEEKQLLSKGDHSFPFSVRVPIDCPQSFEEEGADGIIVYHAHVCITRSGGTDLEYSRKFDVTHPLHLFRVSHAEDPIEVHREKIIKGCCTDGGAVDVHITSKKTGYIPGETMTYEIKLDNHSSRTINKVHCSLCKRMIFKGKSKSGKQTEKKFSDKHLYDMFDTTVECKSGESEDLGRRSYVIPELPPSYYEGCDFIDCLYYIQVKLSFKKSLATIKAQHEVIIGTTATPEHLQVDNNGERKRRMSFQTLVRTIIWE
ncbi:hypothetical protein FSP39_019639 [Pinctada imbricata]|uniref:BRCT domain-containing protein n=1 Tax=Pinctada imbricata TaxID=66713 RepID=A0AA88YV36_PINIB|nr:hypothetical protein FSP39_019639 [Pinctada imbricata]